MGTTYKGKGDILEWTNGTGSDVSADEVIVLAGYLVAVALADIANGASGSVSIMGKHELSATAAEAWGQGTQLYWNTSTSKLTADETAGYPRAGIAAAAKAASATTAVVRLGVHAAGGGAAAGGAADWQESVADSLDFSAAEPAAPSVGDRYMNTGSGASSETAQTVAANELLVWNGTDWTRITPTEGMMVLTEDDGVLYGFNGASWVALGTLANIKDLTDGGNADALHVHDTPGITDYAVGKAKLAEQAADGDGSVFVPFTLEFDVDASEGNMESAAVPAGIVMVVLHAHGYKKTANGAHGDDQIALQDGDGNQICIAELNGVNDTVHFDFAGPPDATHREIPATKKLTVVPGENGAGQGDAKILVECAWKTAP